MWIDIFMLVLSLVIILLSCELFTNGIEWLGKKLNVGDGVVGSIFSAVGTCLPETMVPIIAIMFANNGKDSVDVGIGAIIGAPFMLSTLAFFLSGLSVLIFWKRRRSGSVMHVNARILSRDIGFFIIVYSIGIAASFINSASVKYIIAMFLLAYYIYYIILTVKSDHITHGELEPLYMGRYLGGRSNLLTIVLQIALALTGIILGAHIFVDNLESTSEIIGIPTLVLSLIITPIATELPEKFNSVIWISKRRDTLALGNITGAMVFQSCIPVAIGILATSWQLDIKALMSGILSILSATVTYLWIKLTGKLTPAPLLTGGAFYIAFIAFLVMRGFQ